MGPPLLANVTSTATDCLTEVRQNSMAGLLTHLQAAPTATVTKAVYALWVWAIYFTFPGRVL